jgi:hypothetical protein
MDLTMDLSVRKQQSPAPPSRPILNPAAPSNMLLGSPSQSTPHIPPVVQQQIKQQQQYIPVPPIAQQHQQRVMHQSKYAQLLNVIEEMGKDIKPTYAGNKNSAERLRRAIASARILVRECQLECDRNSRT